MGICRGLRGALGDSRVSSFSKSYVSLSVARGVGGDGDSGWMGDGGRSFNTESMTAGGMTIGTCLGLCLLKPAS